MKKATLGGFLLAATLSLAGCQEEAIKDFGPKAERPLPEKLVQQMKAKGMTRYSPVMFRIFKEEGKFEVWKRKDTGRYDLVTTYDICKISGELGPKFTEGDRQAPEGFYPIRPYQMNPKSSYYLAFDTGFPNAYDRVHGRTGANLMVHGACSSSGCYSMSDEQVAQIYAFARDAFRGGQTEIQLEAFPFRMTAANMARYRSDPNFPFWQMLKEGYDHFEIAKVPPKVDVCEKRYVFNLVAEAGKSFKASEACPAAVQSDSIKVAYSALQESEKSAFSAATSQNLPPPAPSIAGVKEANLVSAWSKARSAGKKVSRLPPSFETAEKQKAEEDARKALAAAPVPEPKPADAAAAESADSSATADTGEPAPAKKKWWKVFGG
jgi:murein L,D-transpeptidase YafK